MLYKVFVTHMKDEKSLGEGILCKDFYSLEDAVKEGAKNMILPESFFVIHAYCGSYAVIGNKENDTGTIVYDSREACRCEFKDCYFNHESRCLQKDGGGISYRLNASAREKHKKQSTEVKLFCRCCTPDIGQYSLVPRLVKFAVDWDFYEFSDSYENSEDLLIEILKCLENKEGVKQIMQYLKDFIKDSEVSETRKEAEELLYVLELYFKDM